MPATSTTVGIIGAGTMGSGIALTALLADIPVVLYDVAPDMLSRARGYIETYLGKKGKTAYLSLLDLSSDLQDLAGCDFVIEAAPEDLDLKTSLFSQVDRICPPPAILATNTSTLSVTAIASATETPERLGGMHFFNPAPVLPLVEVIQGARTSQATLDSLAHLAQKLGKTPVVARDTPGFIVNRVARPFYGEALRMFGEGGASIDQIDRIVREGGGFRMGPFELMDLIGIDVNYAATRSIFEQTFGEPRYRPHPIQAQMVAQRALGRKTGRGFYEYSGQETENRRVSPAFGGTGYSAGQRTNSKPSFLESMFFVPGKWSPGMEMMFRERAVRLVGEDDPNPGIVVVCLGRDEGLRERLRSLENKLDPTPYYLCQCLDVTLSEVASWLAHPEKLAGLDSLFLGNGSVATLVATPVTTSETRAAAENFVLNLDRSPSWVEDVPGLVLPRIIACLANEAAFAAGEGVASQETIDLAMRLGTNYPNGPLAWAREIGYAQIVAILDHLHSEYGEERYRVAPLLRRWARLDS